MLKTRIIFILIFCIQSAIIYGQSIIGEVFDTNQEPIIGAQIQHLKTNNHSHSDDLGVFKMQNVNIGDSLKFTHIAYETIYVVLDSTMKKLRVLMPEFSISLSEVVISPEENPLYTINKLDLKANPVSSSQDILKQVPGLIIGQHAGGGKAEQIFLRGFDIDHGTDIAISVDGLPVNMVSHAHGQGYADMHFIIPELVEGIEFGKGPYYAEHGNFNTAGYVELKTKKKLDHSQVKLEFGQFNTSRVLTVVDLTNKNQDKVSSYIAGEYLFSDGAFESPQNFNRVNLTGKYTNQISEFENLELTASYFTSEWTASGQVPMRSIENGSISRFGAIDDTEGGKTNRANVLLRHNKFFSENKSIETKLFYSKYDFNLFSNFTFFLEDPVNGDQIRQTESRNLYGLQSAYKQSFQFDTFEGDIKVGAQLRYDKSENNELARTLNRSTTLSQIQFGDINEINTGLFFNSSLKYENWTLNTGLRFDQFRFQYQDNLSPSFSNLVNYENVWSPSIGLFYNHSRNLQFYAKSGKGFHTNDTRIVINNQADIILPSAYGVDLGVESKPSRNIFINSSLWYLFSEQEFVYVGDAGVIEPSGSATRYGVDFSIRFQPKQWIMIDADLNYTIARFTDEVEGENYIPLAPDFTFTTGIKINHPSGFYSGARLRYLDDRPANENNSIIAEGYVVLDANIGYEWKRINFGIQIQNLLNTDWNETQFATESRLINELEPVEEIHFTPGTPFFLKGIVEYKF